MSDRLREILSEEIWEYNIFQLKDFIKRYNDVIKTLLLDANPVVVDEVLKTLDEFFYDDRFRDVVRSKHFQAAKLLHSGFELEKYTAIIDKKEVNISNKLEEALLNYSQNEPEPVLNFATGIKPDGVKTLLERYLEFALESCEEYKELIEDILVKSDREIRFELGQVMRKRNSYNIIDIGSFLDTTKSFSTLDEALDALIQDEKDIFNLYILNDEVVNDTTIEFLSNINDVYYIPKQTFYNYFTTKEKYGDLRLINIERNFFIKVALFLSLNIDPDIDDLDLNLAEKLMNCNGYTIKYSSQEADKCLISLIYEGVDIDSINIILDKLGLRTLFKREIKKKNSIDLIKDYSSNPSIYENSKSKYQKAYETVLNQIDSVLYGVYKKQLYFKHQLDEVDAELNLVNDKLALMEMTEITEIEGSNKKKLESNKRKLEARKAEVEGKILFYTFNNKTPLSKFATDKSTLEGNYEIRNTTMGIIIHDRNVYQNELYTYFNETTFKSIDDDIKTLTKEDLALYKRSIMTIVKSIGKELKLKPFKHGVILPLLMRQKYDTTLTVSHKEVSNTLETLNKKLSDIDKLLKKYKK